MHFLINSTRVQKTLNSLLRYEHLSSSCFIKARQVYDEQEGCGRSQPMRHSVRCLHCKRITQEAVDSVGLAACKNKQPCLGYMSSDLSELWETCRVGWFARRGLFISWSVASHFIVSAPFIPPPETGSRAIKYRINDINLVVDHIESPAQHKLPVSWTKTEANGSYSELQYTKSANEDSNDKVAHVPWRRVGDVRGKLHTHSRTNRGWSNLENTVSNCA